MVDQCKSVEFRDKMESIEEDCDIENSGSSTLKEIHLLVKKRALQFKRTLYCVLQRFATEFYDGSLKELLRIEGDGPPDESGSPHIYAIEVER